MFTQPTRNIETSINSDGHTKDRTDDVSLHIQRWTYQGQYSSSFSSHKCPHTLPVDGTQGIFERFKGERKGTIREYLEGKPYCFECALIIYLVEEILPGWAQRNLVDGKVECYSKDLYPPFSMYVMNKEEFYGEIMFLLKPKCKSPCNSITLTSLHFLWGSLSDL